MTREEIISKFYYEEIIDSKEYLEDCPYKAADMNFEEKISLTNVSQMVVFYNSI